MRTKAPHWLADAPPWLEPLYLADDTLDWLSESTSAERTSALEGALSVPGAPDHPLFAPVLERCRQRRPLALAQAPEVVDRRGIHAYRPTLWLDRAAPEQLWLGFDADTAPFFWEPAGADGAALGATVARLAGEVRHELDLDRHVRLFVGHVEQLGGGLEDLVTTIGARPGVDGLRWGTEPAFDPWPARWSGNMIAFQMRSAEVLAQRPDALPAISTRTVHSGSVITARDFAGFLTVDVRYASGHRGAAGLASLEGNPFPVDLPMDALAALFGLPLHAARAMRDACAERSDEHFRYDAGAYAAMCFDDLAEMQWLLHDVLTGDADRRALAAELADRLELVGELLRLLARERDPVARQRLMDLTHVGAPS
ncbi:MAG: hypothetical protein R3B82_24210 [Sandaracinaceae bacterium]